MLGHLVDDLCCKNPCHCPACLWRLYCLLKYLFWFVVVLVGVVVAMPVESVTLSPLICVCRAGTREVHNKLEKNRWVQ